jgi:hypothetical protein
VWKPFPETPFNIVRGTNPDTSSLTLYQPTDYPEQKIASTDGIERSQTLDLPLVQEKRRAQRIAAQTLQRLQYQGQLTARFGIRAWLLKRGQAIKLSYSLLGWSEKLFRVTEITFNADASVNLALREESPAIYAWAASEVASVTPAPPVTYDPLNAPFILAAAEAGDTAKWSGVIDDGGKPENNATRNNPRGVWNAGTAYSKGDFVSDSTNEHTYIALQDVPAGTALTNTTYWSLFLQSAGGAAGQNAVSAFLTNEAHVVSTAADGTGGSYTSAGGTMRIFDGIVEKTTAGSPTVVYSVVGGTSWISINAVGVYTVTDPGADAATATLRCVYSGITFDLTYSISKSKTGVAGAAGAAAKGLVVSSDRQTITYDSAGNPSPASQTTTFTATKQNSTAVVNWTATRADGVSISPVTLLLSAATGDSVTMTAGNFDTQRGTTLGVIVAATITDGLTLSDRISVVKVQDGAQGAQGIQGVPGGSLYTWVAYANALDGSVDFTTGLPGTRAYIGISSNNVSSVESTNPADYTWSPYSGPALFGLYPRGFSVVAGNSVIKNGGGTDWNSDCYSTEAWVGGAFCSFRAGQTNAQLMAGLNSDPGTDSSYTSLDHAWYANGDGTCSVYESGASVASGFSYDSNTVFAVVYDGKTVRYLRNGVVEHNTPVAANLKFYFDCSLSTPGCRFLDIGFGPNGTAGDDGIDGISHGVIYQRSATQPATPAASTTTPSGWYESTGAVPSGSNPMWGSAWTRENPTANRIYQTPVRVEAISAVATGQTVPLAFTVSSSLSFSLGPGLSRLVNGQGRLDAPTGAGSVYVQIESRVAGGSWSASNGASEPYAVGEPAVPSHQITVTNSGSTTVNYEVRGTIIRSNSNSGALTASESVLSI